MKERDLATKAADALLGCLKEVPFAYITEVERELAADAPDLLARLSLPGSEQILAVEVRPSGQPRQVREAAGHIRRLKETLPHAYGVIAAPYVSPQAAEVCAEEGLGYIDLAGNCRLAFGQVYIRRQGSPKAVTRRRALRSLYSPKAERVLRVLLADPRRLWKMQPLAAEAGVSLGQAANVKKLLVDREWARSSAQGFGLGDPEALLADWAANYSYRRSRVYDLYALDDADAVERSLAAACLPAGVRFALTGLSAAARLAPTVRYMRASAYVEGDPADVAHQLGWRPVTSGANVRLLAPYDEGVFYGSAEQGGIPLVSPAQAYLDLQGPEERSEEAAAALLEEVIRPSWKANTPATGPR